MSSVGGHQIGCAAQSSLICENTLAWDNDLEQQVLGSMLSAPKTIPIAACELVPTDFCLPTHQLIFQAICQLSEQNVPVDPFVLADHLKDRAEFQALGGRLYLLALTGLVRIASDIRQHAALLRRLSVEREAQGLSRGFLSGELNIEGLYERAGQLLSRATCLASPLLTLRELFGRTSEEPNWVVKCLVARGAITDIAAKIKVGKTTFVLAMIAAILAGRDFLDFPTFATPVLYLTEERPPTFTQACRRVGLTPRDDFHVLLRQDAPGDWAQVGTLLARETKRLGIGLVVIDTLADWAGLKADEENTSGAALSAMRPVQALADQNVGVIMVRHEKKGATVDLVDSSRGSSAFGGAADILLALRPAMGAGGENRRQLVSRGRFDDCPGELALEMQDGTYQRRGTGRRMSKTEAKDVLLAQLPYSIDEAMSRQQIEALCPEVSKTTIKEILTELSTTGLISRRNRIFDDPRAYGYWLENGGER